MKLKSATYQTVKPRHFMLVSALLLTSACHATDQVKGQVTAETSQIKEPSAVLIKESSKMPENQPTKCHIISSNNWSAQLETSKQGKPILAIKGDIELPSPGYSAVLEQGMADRSATPSQHFNLKTEQLNGMHIQVITPMTLQHSAPAIAKQYRSIVIHCGDQIIATIDNVVMQSS